MSFRVWTHEVIAEQEGTKSDGKEDEMEEKCLAEGFGELLEIGHLGVEVVATELWGITRVELLLTVRRVL